MTLQVHKAPISGFFQEHIGDTRTVADEGHIHKGTVFLFGSTPEQLAVIQIIVQQRRLFLIALCHHRKAAHILQPLKYLAADVNAVGRGRVVHRAVISVGLVAEHGGGVEHHVIPDQVLPDDGNDHTGRADIFLYAAVDHTVLAHIHGLGQETAGNVRYQIFTLGVGKLCKTGAVNGVVLADVHIVRVGIDRKIGAVGDVGKALVSGGGNGSDLAVTAGLFVGFFCPNAGNDIVRDAVSHQVHGDGRKLLAGAALQKQYLVVAGNTHQLPQIRFRLVDNGLISL